MNFTRSTVQWKAETPLHIPYNHKFDGSNQNTIFQGRHFVLSDHTLNKYAKLILIEAITNMIKPVAVLQGIFK